jgi:hypothetical protein
MIFYNNISVCDPKVKSRHSVEFVWLQKSKFVTPCSKFNFNQLVKVADNESIFIPTRCYSHGENVQVDKFRKSFSQILLSTSEISQHTKKLFKFILDYWIDKITDIILENIFF